MTVIHLPVTRPSHTADPELLAILEERQQRRIVYRGELGRLIEIKQREIENVRARLAR